MMAIIYAVEGGAEPCLSPPFRYSGEMENKIFRAMSFAHTAHKSQVRKYTNAPYFTHLAEVGGLAASVAPADMIETMVSVAWLHDCMEDQDVLEIDLVAEFGDDVAEGVQWLSDMEEGNRKTRKALAKERLAKAPGWVQTIKCADLISNTPSIVQFDPKFAEVYLAEKRDLLPALEKADRRLWNMAWDLAQQPVPA